MNKKVKGKLRIKTAKNGHFRKKRVRKSIRIKRHVEAERSTKIAVVKTRKALKSRAFL